MYDLVLVDLQERHWSYNKVQHGQGALVVCKICQFAGDCFFKESVTVKILCKSYIC